MNCEKYIEIMMRELDGEATAAEKLELRGHLMNCERCRALYETYQNIDAGIMDMEEEAPEGLTEAVMGAVRQEKEKQSPLYFLKRYKFTVAAIAACFVLVVAGRGIGFGSAEEADAASLARMEPEAAVEEAAPAEAAMPAPEAALMPAYDGVEVAATVGSVDHAAVLEALQKDHRSGDLVFLTGNTADDVFGLFGTIYILDIPDGYRVYRVLREDFEEVMDQLSFSDVVSTNPPGEDVYLYIVE